MTWTTTKRFFLPEPSVSMKRRATPSSVSLETAASTE
jgi:hypothetical protein